MNKLWLGVGLLCCSAFLAKAMEEGDTWDNSRANTAVMVGKTNIVADLYCELDDAGAETVRAFFYKPGEPFPFAMDWYRITDKHWGEDITQSRQLHRLLSKQLNAGKITPINGATFDEVRARCYDRLHTKMLKLGREVDCADEKAKEFSCAVLRKEDQQLYVARFYTGGRLLKQQFFPASPRAGELKEFLQQVIDEGVRNAEQQATAQQGRGSKEEEPLPQARPALALPSSNQTQDAPSLLQRCKRYFLPTALLGTILYWAYYKFFKKKDEPQVAAKPSRGATTYEAIQTWHRRRLDKR